jgi:phage I-like protein
MPILSLAVRRFFKAKILNISAGGNETPTEFRLFKAGTNETTKGVFLFDAKAAEMVIAAWKEHGVDLAIDLEHLSLDDDSRSFDPDARGWFGLEVRNNGELWAVNVRWTPDGARRLSEKTQRYVSPAFTVDDENRITEIVNIALVAMPATHGTPALVAAHRGTRMSVKEAARALIPVLTVQLSNARALGG